VAKGIKTGGRQKGTPNRPSADVRDILVKMKCEPIEGIARIAMDEKNPPDLRGRMYAELASFVYPKRKAVEVSGEVQVRLADQLREARQRVLNAARSRQVAA
jgi:hypothetical protein